MYLRKNVLLAIIGVELLIFAMALHITWCSWTLPKLLNATTSPLGRIITKSETSWLSSIHIMGAITGTYLLSYSLNKLGKKLTLTLGGVPCLVSSIIIYYSTSVELYIFSRLIAGLSAGLIFIFPIYLAELTHKNMREVLGALGTCAICGGYLFSNSVGPFLSIQSMSLLMGTAALFSVVYFSIFGQEVPHFYVIKNNETLARKALETLRGGYEDLDEAFDEIKNKYEEEKQGTLKDIFVSKSSIKGFIICTILIIFNIFSGNNILIVYGETFIHDINPNLSPEISNILLTIVIFLTSLIMPPVCFKFPKKLLLIFSGFGMFLSNAALAVYIYCDRNFELPKSTTSLPLILLTSFLTAYSLGYSTLPFVLLGEVFPNRVKSVAISSIAFIIGVVSFIFTKYYIYITDAIGIDGFFAFCAVSCLCSCIFTKYYVIETKDKSLVQIQDELSL